MKRKKILYIFIITISITLLILCTCNIITWVKDKNNIQKLEEELKNIQKEEIENKYDNSLINPPKDKNDSYWDYINLDFLQVDFSDLISKNSNTIAWIKVNGTNIDYPIVQTDDNEYYLTHSFDKKYSKAGAIFSDYRNDLNNLNYNTIIYGHARLDDTMFGSLRFTLNEDWYNDKNNHIIKISTPNENMIWQIFSVYVIPTESYYIKTNFLNESSFQSFLDIIASRSIYKFRTSVNTNDKILTLSTCKNDSNKRIVVHAKLIKKETRSL